MWDVITGECVVDVGLPLLVDALAFDGVNMRLAVSNLTNITIYATEPKGLAFKCDDSDLKQSGSMLQSVLRCFRALLGVLLGILRAEGILPNTE
jgi:hypothetical protein